MTDTTQQEREAFTTWANRFINWQEGERARAWEIWQAARATPQGAEPVAEVYTMEALVPGGGVKYHARMLSACPPGTKLYTHPPEPIQEREKAHEWPLVGEQVPVSDSLSACVVVDKSIMPGRSHGSIPPEPKLSELQPDAWQPIETAPSGVLVVVFWRNGEGEDMHEFDYIEDECWMKHHDYHDHVVCIGGWGVSETPPYTHWMPLPPPPADLARQEGSAT